MKLYGNFAVADAVKVGISSLQWVSALYSGLTTIENENVYIWDRYFIKCQLFCHTLSEIPAFVKK